MYSTTIAKTETIEVPFADMPKAVQEKIIAYGCQRIFNDMVGGSERFPTVADKVAHVKAQIARFLAGDIGRASGGGAVPERTKVARAIVRALLKDKYGAKSPEWAAFTGLDDDAQAEKLDAVFAKNEEKLAPKVDAELKRREAERKAKASMKVDIDL